MISIKPVQGGMFQAFFSTSLTFLFDCFAVKKSFERIGNIF